MEKSIEFTSQISKEDIKEFHFNHFKKRRTVKVLRVIMLIPAMFYIFYTYKLKKLPPLIESTASITFIISSFFFIHLLTYLRTKINVKNNNQIGIDNHYTISSISIYSKSDLHEGTITWKSIYSVEETNGLIVLYMNKIIGILIPKRYLTEEQISELKSIISKQDLVYKPLKK